MEVQVLEGRKSTLSLEKNVVVPVQHTQDFPGKIFYLQKHLK